MADDWKVGDLAVFVGGSSAKTWTAYGHKTSLGAIRRVLDVISRPHWDGMIGLVLEGDPSPHSLGCWCADQWRKVRPDELEDCEPEFVTLLNRIKRKVAA